MRRRAAAVPAVLFCMLASLPARGGDAPLASAAEDVERFVALVRQYTAKYHDRARAVADGYRRIGRDFPGMGEHWIHVGLLFDGIYDPARPEFLSYVEIDGEPKLLGVAYGLPLLANESPPDRPAGREGWHDHRGSIDEETFLPHHHESGHAGHGPRLAMVHAWVWQTNPEGLFAADNWSIPFLRLRLEPPSLPASAAAKALSLLTGGDRYVADVVVKAEGGSEPSRALSAAVSRARDRVAKLLGERPATPADSQLGALSAAWHELWSDIESSLPPAASQRLRASAAR